MLYFAIENGFKQISSELGFIFVNSMEFFTEFETSFALNPNLDSANLIALY